MPKTSLLISLLLWTAFASAQTADFTFKSNSQALCAPATIQFTQNATGSPLGFFWNFGNSTQGVGGDVSVTYINAGTYTVTMTAIYDQTSVTVAKTIVVNPAVVSSIGTDRNYICTPGVINFTGISTGNIVDYAWDFGDSSGLTNVATNNTAHSYSNFGNYQVTLKSTDISGCVGQAGATVQVTKPTISATATPPEGCIPADVNFVANVNVPVKDFVTSYTWDFNDGIPVSSTNSNSTIHQYAAVGTHSPSVSITTNDGCTNSFAYPVIAYGIPPTNLVAFPRKTVVCGSEAPQFYAAATNANSYRWNFGDGTTVSVTDTVTQHKYSTLGSKTVTVTPYFNGCAGTPATFKITIVGVIAKDTYKNTCGDRKTYSFTNTSLGNLSTVLWDFGDNTGTLSTTNATHTFAPSGEFITKVTVTDAITGCDDTFSQTIYTADPIMVNVDSSICKYTNTTFSLQNTYTNSAATYTWNVAGIKNGPSKNASLSVKAGILGNFNNFVSINYGGQSCPDTVRLSHSLLVKGANLTFTAPSSLCFNAPFSIVNNSQPFIPTDSVVLWYWNYGNTNVNDTIYQPNAFQYGGPGSFRIKLTGIDINGCKDSLTKTIVINPLPFLQVVPNTDTLCQGQTGILRAFSNQPIVWSPTNNLSCTTCDSVVANPSVTTKYFVTATTPSNCISKDSVLVKVYNPFTATARPNIFYICQNQSAQLDVSPKSYVVNWAPAAGLSNPNTHKPIASPSQTTRYIATLTDSVGCFTSNATVDVVIKSLPTVDAGPDKVVSYNSKYTMAPAYSPNVRQYSWTPSSLLSCSNCAIPNGIALHSETYTIQVTSDSGCVASDSLTVFVECKNANILMPTAFTPNNDNLNDVYYPLTRGIKIIKRFTVYNREGKLMYEAQNFPPNTKYFGWNGQYKGQIQSPAAYVYTLEVICELGETLTKKGSFLLLR
ncbi:MAG: Gliding motility-associated C-terminal protein [Ferruginibacter sp.]|nr:Gliding motility-associated C-terminal protein [Ferruginibacter sp.]